jgi:xanthine dehydrogenase YagS FAD-binding subunit
MLPEFSYVRPKSVEEAIRHLSGEAAWVHAGGTDLLGCLRDGVFMAKTLVSINGLRELRGTRQTADRGLLIGALTSIRELAESPIVLEHYRALAEGAAEVASPQLRHQGSIGGNVCQKPRCWYYRGEFHCLRKGGDLCYAVGGESHYHCIFGGDRCFIVHPSDTAPALVAFDGKARLAGPKGQRIVPLEQFFVLPSQDPERETVLEPGEILMEILLPPPIPGVRSAYRKVRARRSWDFALAGVALALGFQGDRVTQARVVLSGAAPIPWRSKEVEELLVGRALDAETAHRAAEAAVRGAQPLKHNGYKIPLFRGLVQDTLLALASQ